jgi:hypothetical protein
VLSRALRLAKIYTLIANAKLNDIDPQAWLAPACQITPAKRINELLPWNWRPQSVAHAACAQSARRHLAALRVAEGNHPSALLVRVRNDQALRSSNQRKRFLAANN